ncbi:hypothetical protein QCA50_019638 [Cerrena zonata]|uniref:C2H2-type domain-containing protein n=1 Tax=Cerrena zonata TaxID=2478898 RepID=A0AAW0FEE1_9APHY
MASNESSGGNGPGKPGGKANGGKRKQLRFKAKVVVRCVECAWSRQRLKQHNNNRREHRAKRKKKKKKEKKEQKEYQRQFQKCVDIPSECTPGALGSGHHNEEQARHKTSRHKI